jgi:glycosyltransferase involved in cell wall biosynthesis
VIRVGITEAHGMAVEASLNPPPGVRYSFLRPKPESFRFIRSPIKGYYRRFDADSVDLIEAVISPAKTRSRWIFHCENLQSVAAFSVLGIPLPRALRVMHISRMFRRENFKKLIFWSEAARRTLTEYAGIDDPIVASKATVVYPAVRSVDDTFVRFDDRPATFLFSGDFFRKGGVNVVDAFERLHRGHRTSRLVLCCAEADFRSPNEGLRDEYLDKVRRHPGVEWLGRISRERMLTEVLPSSDVYLLPTYVETFGMSILEAMAFGVPVIATNHFAIPEMIEDETSGLLIDSSRWDCEALFRGYTVDRIPSDFRDHLTNQLFLMMERLVEDVALRKRLGTAAVATARSKFSFAHRNARMLEIYNQALQ